MGSLAVIGLLALTVIALFGGACGFGTAAVVRRIAGLSKPTAAALGGLLWAAGSGALLTIVLRGLAAPRPEFPHPREELLAIIPPFVGALGVVGGILGGLAFLRWGDRA